jgi:hypothetical protein
MFLFSSMCFNISGNQGEWPTEVSQTKE